MLSEHLVNLTNYLEKQKEHYDEKTIIIAQHVIIVLVAITAIRDEQLKVISADSLRYLVRTNKSVLIEDIDAILEGALNFIVPFVNNK